MLGTFKCRFVYLLLFFNVFFIDSAEAINCNYVLNAQPINVNSDTDQDGIDFSVHVSVGNSSVHCRQFFLAFDYGYSGDIDREAKSVSGKDEEVEYNIYKNSRMRTPLKDKKDIRDTDDYIEGRFNPGNQNLVLNGFFKLGEFGDNDIEDLVSGQYRDFLKVKLYSRVHDRYVFQKMATMTVNINISPSVHISITDLGGAFDPTATYKEIDFGELRKGLKKEALVQIKSNDSYTLEIESVHKGFRHTQGLDTIAYQYSVLGHIWKASPDRKRWIIQRKCDDDDIDRYRFEFEVSEDTTDKKGGNYEDYVLLTVRPH